MGGMRYYAYFPNGDGEPSGDEGNPGDESDVNGERAGHAMHGPEVMTVPGMPPWFGAAEGEVPAVAGQPRLLAESDRASLILRRCDVYTTGVVFKLRLDLRFDRFAGWQPLREERRILVPDMYGPTLHPQVELLLSVRLPDGTEVQANAGHPGGADDGADSPGPQLAYQGNGGGGGEDSWIGQMQLWLWPLPEEGELQLHYACPGAGIDPGHVSFDAAELSAAAAAVLRVNTGSFYSVMP